MGTLISSGRAHAAARPKAMHARIWRFDWQLFLITLALVAVGVVMIYSASGGPRLAEGPLLENPAFRQLLFAGVGLVFYFILQMVDYHLWVRHYLWLYLAVLGLLGVTMVIGRSSFGAQSWLRVGFVDVQPSEVSKLLMILVLARCLGDEKESLESPRAFATSILLILPPAVLIYLQPDFGTAVILVAIWVGMVFLAGVRWRHILIFLLLGVAAAPIIWFQLKDYMRKRIITFLFPGSDPSGASYNVTQALISIGSGGLWGKGLFRGTQSQLHFLRVRHTDFIFSVLAEELGFAGAVVLLILFALLVLRLLSIARSAPDRSGALIASGVATMILVQTLINLGMNANLLPVTGLPLPLVSYGGSSLIATLMALGIAQSVARHRRRPEANLL